MSAALATAALSTALRRGAPPRRTVVVAVAVGAIAQLCGVALVAGAVGLFVWSSTRPGLQAVAGLLVAVEVVAFARAPLRHAERACAHDLGLGGLTGWRTWLLDGVATWAPSRLADARAGDLLARCLEDADRLQDLWVRVLVPAGSALAALLVASCLFAVALPYAGLAVGVATVAVAAATWLASARVASLGVAESALRGEVAARVVEFAHGAEALSLLRADTDHLAATVATVRRADALAARRASIGSAISVLAALAAAGAFLVAAAAISFPVAHPALSAGVVLGVLACGELLVAIPSTLEALGSVAGAASRIGTLASPLPAGTHPAVGGALVLDAVDVTASAGTPVLLSAVRLTVEPASTASVSGPSGSGKSSLLAVAARLEAPAAGTVSIGGVDMAVLEESSLRQLVGWLPTEPGLLEGRVRDVLDVGRGLGDEALRDAIEAVGLADVLAARGGLDAMVGERGSDLSSGERRRLALARVLAGAPALYLLDEPTAGLDDAAADVVLASLDASGAAVLAATHDGRVESWAQRSRTIDAGRVV